VSYGHGTNEQVDTGEGSHLPLFVTGCTQKASSMTRRLTYLKQREKCIINHLHKRIMYNGEGNRKLSPRTAPTHRHCPNTAHERVFQFYSWLN